MNTAVNAAVQIEPFKFFHKINESISDYQEPLHFSNSQLLNVGDHPGRSNKPAGIAHLGESCKVFLFLTKWCYLFSILLTFPLSRQIGFTCFWPNGGGLKETPTNQLRYQQQGTWENENADEDIEAAMEAFDEWIEVRSSSSYMKHLIRLT